MDVSDKLLTYHLTNLLVKCSGWYTRRDVVNTLRKHINSAYELDETIVWLVDNGVIKERTVKTGGRLRREYCHRVHWEDMSRYERESGTDPIRDVLREDGDWVARSQLHYGTRLNATEMNSSIRRLLDNGEIETRVLRTGGKPRTEYRLINRELPETTELRVVTESVETCEVNNYIEEPKVREIPDKREWSTSNEVNSVEEYDRWEERQKARNQEKQELSPEERKQLMARYETNTDEFRYDGKDFKFPK